MSGRHEWTDDLGNGRIAKFSVVAHEDGRESLFFDFAGCRTRILNCGYAVREILRLAARVRELETELVVACDKQTAHWMAKHSEERSRAETAERRVAELERLLAEAEEAIQFADPFLGCPECETSGVPYAELSGETWDTHPAVLRALKETK